MILFALTFFANCLIPEQFRDLVDKAILNSTIKVSKSLREDTKYPGDYTFGNAHFTLHKVLSSSQTTDIKGYAIEKNYAAIVKRKKFNIKDGFTIIDYKNNEFYTMEKVVASDEKVNVYKIKPIDIFNVFSDIEAKVHTPLVTVGAGYNWDSKRNRPKLISLGLFSVGAGCYFSASVHAKVKFHSLKKAEINTDITLIGKIGAEFAAKKGDYKIPDIQIFPDLDIPIPGAAISFKFLGLHFDFGVYATFGSMLRDLEKKLEVDIDYFKGYQLTAKRFICIKRHGTSDSGWQTDLSPIPAGNIVNGNATDLQSNFIQATFQLKSGIKIKADIFKLIRTSFAFGILKQFKIDFGFVPLACPYPYLYGRFELPILTFYEFSGIILRIRFFGKKKKYTLLKPNYKEKYIFSLIKTRKYCLYDSSNINDYDILTEMDDYDGDDDDEFANETSNRIINLDVKNLASRTQTKSLISLQLSLSEFNSSTNSEIQLFSRRSSPYEDINSKKSTYETSIVEAGQNRVTSKISFCFYYFTGTNTVEKSDDYSFLLKEYLRKDDDYIKTTISNSKKTEEISVDFRLKYCETIDFHKMYIPSLSLAVINSSLKYGEKICIIVKDLNENTTDYVDEGASFLTDGTVSKSLENYGIYTHNDEFFYIQFDNISLPSSPDSGTSVRYEINAEFGKNYEEEVLLISNFSQAFKKGDNIISNDFHPKVRITNDMRLSVLITYINNFNTIPLDQKITYSEIEQMVKSNKMSLIKTQQNTKISCGISIQRYDPIIRINCSTKNSTHRIVTRVYTLESVKPSEYKPSVIHFDENQTYGVFEIKRIHQSVTLVIIHMPFLTPLCNFTMLSDDYYQFQFEKDTIYIPFRRENSTEEDFTIDNVVQGHLIDEETIFFSQNYYTINFDETPIALAFVRTFKDQYSITGVEGTKQTLVNYSDPSFQLLALEYMKDKTIIVASSLIVIDDKHPLAEKTIPNFPNWETVTYHVWCERADEIVIHDKTTHETIEKNTEKDGEFFKLQVKPNHIIDFIPICTSNKSQPMCYIRQTFPDHKGYDIFRYPDKNGITILNTSLDDLFEQEDRQGLIEEAIKTERSFYYMTSFSKQVQIIRHYENQLDLQLRIIEVKDKYKKFCVIDPDGFIVPVSRKYYSDHYNKFMIELGIEYTDPQYLDFVSGEEDSCVYATYNSSNYTDYQDENYNDTDLNDSDYSDIDMSWNSELETYDMMARDGSEPIIHPSNNICDLAKSLKVSYYKDIKQLIPPATFDYEILKIPKAFDDGIENNVKLLNYEIAEYFVKAKLMVEPETNNSIYVLDLPFKEIVFDTTLKENEYIKGEGNMTIHYTGGVLNYILPDGYNTIIDLNKANEIHLNLIGKGRVEIKTSGKSTLKIIGKINLDSVKTIYVDNDVKTVEIENVNVANYSEFYVKSLNNYSADIKIKNLTLLEHSKGNFTNLEVTETLIIKQTATAIFDTLVNVKNADLFIDMIAYQNDLIPMIRGSLLEPPKSILIQRVSEDGPKHKDEYLFFDGQFDCQSWVNRMKYGNSFFNTARCANHNYNEARILETEESRAFVSFVRQSQSVKKDYYMTGGLVAIILFSIIDAGLIVFLVFILIRSRKNPEIVNQSSLAQNILEGNDLPVI
ncbi:hypothetical protein M9Y10_022307 [Tritrichomonas musculus]|uniref:Uncharacterized protein n=1 Tax=Tritrichomonas musculus TaxID=1915356 RepID=A0ABR2KS48_9EUKA